MAMAAGRTDQIPLGLNELPGMATTGPYAQFNESEFKVGAGLLPVEAAFNIPQLYAFTRNSYWTAPVYAGVYIACVFMLQAWMKNRKAFDLKGPLILWNAGLAIFSILGTYQLLPLTITEGRHYGFYRLACMGRMDDPIVAFWESAFVLSKVVELGDTLFLILRKRPVIFLHWYHHASALWLTWEVVAMDAGFKRPYILINLAIHSVMYSYFALRATGIRIPKLISMCITGSQILQMVVGVCIASLHMGIRVLGWPCDGRLMSVIGVAINFVAYLYLFTKFFVKSYMGPPKDSRRKKQ